MLNEGKLKIFLIMFIKDILLLSLNFVIRNWNILIGLLFIFLILVVLWNLFVLEDVLVYEVVVVGSFKWLYGGRVMLYKEIV